MNRPNNFHESAELALKTIDDQIFPISVDKEKKTHDSVGTVNGLCYVAGSSTLYGSYYAIGPVIIDRCYEAAPQRVFQSKYRWNAINYLKECLAK